MRTISARLCLRRTWTPVVVRLPGVCHHGHLELCNQPWPLLGVEGRWQRRLLVVHVISFCTGASCTLLKVSHRCVQFPVSVRKSLCVSTLSPCGSDAQPWWERQHVQECRSVPLPWYGLPLPSVRVSFCGIWSHNWQRMSCMVRRGTFCLIAYLVTLSSPLWWWLMASCSCQVHCGILCEGCETYLWALVVDFLDELYHIGLFSNAQCTIRLRNLTREAYELFDGNTISVGAKRFRL